MAAKTGTGAAGRGPFPGSRSYRNDELGRLFGHAGDVRRVVDLWSDQRLTVLHGEPGVGKTSVLQASIAQLIRLRRGVVLPMGSLTNRAPFTAVPLFEHNPLTLAVISSWAPLEMSTRLSAMTLAEFLKRAQGASAKPMFAAIDQAEDLFRGAASIRHYRDHFIDELAAALQDVPGLHVLVVIRDSWLPELLSYERLTPGAQAAFHGLDRAAATEMVQRSAAYAGRMIAPGVAEELVDALLTTPVVDSLGHRAARRRNYMHPAYLQEVAYSLWEALPADHVTITSVDLRRLVDIDGSLAELICRAVWAVSRYYEFDPSQLCRWLSHTFITAAGTMSGISDGADVAAGMPTHVLFAFEDHYLVRSELRSGIRWFQLQCDRLIRPLQLATERIATFVRKVGPVTFADWLDDAVAGFARGDIELADRHAQNALQLSAEVGRRSRAEAETLLGNISYRRGDPEQARAHYLSAAKLFEATRNHTSVGHLLAAIGRLHLTEQDAAAATTTLQSAITRLPADGSVKVELARAFVESGSGRAAVAVLEGVLASDDDREAGEAHLLRSEILTDLGDASGALRDLEQALEVGGNSGRVLLRAAQVQALRGDRLGAARLARRALTATEMPLTQNQRRQADELQERDST